MDLVAIDDGLPFLVRGHQRGEAADDARGILDEYVSELGRLHLRQLRGGLPADGRGLVVSTTGLLDEMKTRVQVGAAKAARTD